jgi:hypothetical protein
MGSIKSGFTTMIYEQCSAFTLRQIRRNITRRSRRQVNGQSEGHSHPKLRTASAYGASIMRLPAAMTWSVGWTNSGW